MQFEKVAKNRWEAKDKADSYEIVRYCGEYCCIKNEAVWFATTSTMEAAIRASDEEQQDQEWFSNNPENEEKNRRAKEQREYDRRKPKLWRGK